MRKMHPQLVKWIDHCSFVAVPLQSNPNLQGVHEALDSLHARQVLITPSLVRVRVQTLGGLINWTDHCSSVAVDRIM